MRPQNKKLSILHKAAKVDLSGAREKVVHVLSLALRDHDGNVTHTARALKIGRQTLIRYMIAYPELRTFAGDLRTKAGAPEAESTHEDEQEDDALDVAEP